MEPQACFFIKYLPVKISLVSTGLAELPTYLGSTLRGVIGQALHTNITAFNYLYQNSTLTGNVQDIVNPYVIIPPAMDKKSIYQPGDALHFHMLLLGEATKYASALIQALSSAKTLKLGAARYPFVLKKIVHSEDQRVMWHNEIYYEAATKNIAFLSYRTLADVKKLTIQMQTPLRIRHKGELLETVTFPTIIRNIVRRMEAIAVRYGGWVDAQEAKEIQTLAQGVATTQNHLAIKNLQRYSNRLGEKMDFSGLLGCIHFEGDITPFVPWLYAAQILHIGRNTTFGMGQIAVEFS